MKLQMAKTRQHLILLPGLDGTGQLFDPLLSVLPSCFEASIVRYPNDRPAHYRDLMPAIRSVIPWDHPYVVVAESFAGPLALKFIEAQQQDIRALVLCASFVTTPVPSASKWTIPGFSKHWLEQEPTPDAVRKTLLDDKAPLGLVNSATSAFCSLKPEVFACRAQMIRNTDVRQDLVACQKPILYLRASNDRFVGQAAAEEIKRLKPSVKTAVVKGPHLLLQRNPREAIEAIRKFLDELPSES
jgi:pimeloyl-ACP methyl ester carboxylesterase